MPARKNSSTIKDKNIKKINGKPLIFYSLRSSKQIKEKSSEIICSTDSLKIKKIAKTQGVEVPYIRPKKISGKYSRDIEFVNFTLKKFFQDGIIFKYGLILRPTSPKRSEEILLKAFKIFKSKKYDSMRSIVESPYPVHKLWFLKKDLLQSVIKTNIYEHYNAPRQILRKTYAQSGNFEFFKINYKKKIRSISGKKIGYYITPKKFENDIDNLQDIKNIKLQ